MKQIERSKGKSKGDDVTKKSFSRRLFSKSSAELSAAAVLCPRLAFGTTPTYRMPPENTIHKRTWMSWPDNGTTIWKDGLLPGMQANIALVARTIAKYEPVVMCANAESVGTARSLCGPSVEVIGNIPVDDCWMRDSGPIFRNNGSSGQDVVGLNFNGWGNKQPHAKDALVASRIAAHLGLRFTAAGLVAEGGAIETDGHGTLMATKSSIINDNRNPGRTADQLEAAMCAAYGASKVIWFEGIKGADITDDHVDATSRFLNQGFAAVQYPRPQDKGVWASDERRQFQTLAASTDFQGRRIQVSKIDGPDVDIIRQHDHPNFVACYANYYVCNGAVICAQFGDASADAAAKATLRGLFPGYVIEQIDIDHIGNGGGGIHCVTQQEPLPI